MKNGLKYFEILETLQDFWVQVFIQQNCIIYNFMNEAAEIHAQNDNKNQSKRITEPKTMLRLWQVLI